MLSALRQVKQLGEKVSAVRSARPVRALKVPVKGWPGEAAVDGQWPAERTVVACPQGPLNTSGQAWASVVALPGGNTDPPRLAAGVQAPLQAWVAALGEAKGLAYPVRQLLWRPRRRLLAPLGPVPWSGRGRQRAKTATLVPKRLAHPSRTEITSAVALSDSQGVAAVGAPGASPVAVQEVRVKGPPVARPK